LNKRKGKKALKECPREGVGGERDPRGGKQRRPNQKGRKKMRPSDSAHEQNLNQERGQKKKTQQSDRPAETKKGGPRAGTVETINALVCKPNCQSTKKQSAASTCPMRLRGGNLVLLNSHLPGSFHLLHKRINKGGTPNSRGKEQWEKRGVTNVAEDPAHGRKGETNDQGLRSA